MGISGVRILPEVPYSRIGLLCNGCLQHLLTIGRVLASSCYACSPALHYFIPESFTQPRIGSCRTRSPDDWRRSRGGSNGWFLDAGG